jgi:hypothetical protein
MIMKEAVLLFFAFSPSTCLPASSSSSSSSSSFHGRSRRRRSFSDSVYTTHNIYINPFTSFSLHSPSVLILLLLLRFQSYSLVPAVYVAKREKNTHTFQHNV